MQNFFLFKKSHHLWTRLSISHRGAIIVAIPTICLICTLGAWIGLRQAWVAVSYQVERRERTIAQSNQLLMTLIDAETGMRGYNISHERRYLDPYYRALANLQPSLVELDRLLKADPQQYQKLQNIKKLTTKQLNILREMLTLIEQKELSNNDSLQEIRLLAQGRDIMDTIRVLVGNLASQEQALLNFYKERSDNIRNTVIWIQRIALVVSIIAYFIAISLFRQLDRELSDRERQLSENKSLIGAVMTNVVDSIIIMNRYGKVETFNLAAAKMFGYEPTEIVGEAMALLLIDPLAKEPSQQEKIEYLSSFLLNLEYSRQITGYQKSGKAFPIEISISQINTEGWLIAIIRDISEREEVNAKLQARSDEMVRLSRLLVATNLSLKRQNQELDRFAYVASHDLKAPLRAIASLSEWIEEDLKGQLSEENQHKMELLRQRVYRMESLIDGLLAYSHIGRTQIDSETFNVGELLQEVVKSLAPPCLFKIEISPEMPTFKARKSLLRKVFLNLIENAIKHHPCPVGCIQISVKDQEKFYEFAIADDGPGIAAAFHEKIFILFQTLLARDVQENTGVGLAVAKKIVESEGGKIWLESNEGEGTTFYFTWPKAIVSGESQLSPWPNKGPA